MTRRILIIVGHPDPAPERLARALAQAYADGATAAGHEVRRIDLARLDVPLLHTRAEFETGQPPAALAHAADDLRWAEHIVFVFPLWLGTMPALLKAFLEQMIRPGVAFAFPESGRTVARPLLRGRSARLVVTMGMPALLYRIWFLSHGTAGLRRSILGFAGIRPVRETLIGLVEGASGAKRAKWLARLRDLGTRAA
ncbi:NAD(P)H-dependent oxidoreductase [Aquibium sp. ELW1220]|uniref:NAD(P)H-dependent oxidoreductase n=1 Tax=Aquibium sp. ELW1220 TaxID=2976766 RepID=UPI0025AFFD30|nr:NAD(P)H-dependent oxidoreductase [Aquibium sp. ELW1220]MDN2579709.1 NAD(P)H-dependent oxidoreductase [Aquibium sp. ELW1220]